MIGDLSMRALVLVVSLLLAVPILVLAEETADWPRISEIRFEGNDTTREQVFLREMDLAPGDPANPERIERNRQAILDLGLFRSVHIDQTPVSDGVVLTVRVREKYYFLAIPRFDTSSDRDYSYGAQVRWNNVWGLNHTLNLYAEQGRYPDHRLREDERSFRLSYNAPYLLGRDSFGGSIERIERVVPDDAGSYDETIDRLELRISRDFRANRPRRGWIASTGLYRQSQTTAGEFAPPPDGTATALVLGADYADVRFYLYSEQGRRFASRLELAQEGWLSDYSYQRLDMGYTEYIGLPWGEHHNLNLIGALGWYGGGTGRIDTYGLGGSGDLRGYPADYLEGQRYGYFSAEYLRPLGPDWLRLLVLAEAGATGGSIEGGREGLYGNIGLGVRIRLTWFINVEIEAGVAWPLRGGEGMQFFAGGN
jgi:outer membrane protein assembly factor BamA